MTMARWARERWSKVFRSKFLMKNFATILSLISLASLPLVPSAHADVLAQAVISESGGTNSVLSPTQTPFSFTIGNVPVTVPSFSNSTTLQFYASDVGETLIISPTQDPVFFSNLVDGQSELVGVGYYGGGYDKPENEFFSSYPTGWNGVDFQGFNIDNLSLTIDSFSLNSPGSDPNHNGQWTDYSYTYTLDVNGEVVPEPAAGFLAMTGILFFALFRAFRARKEKSN